MKIIIFLALKKLTRSLLMICQILLISTKHQYFHWNWREILRKVTHLLNDKLVYDSSIFLSEEWKNYLSAIFFFYSVRTSEFWNFCNLHFAKCIRPNCFNFNKFIFSLRVWVWTHLLYPLSDNYRVSWHYGKLSWIQVLKLFELLGPCITNRDFSVLYYQYL